jgi:hypothetical protein
LSPFYFSEQFGAVEPAMSHDHSYSPESDDGISVIELVDPPSGAEVLAGVLGAYHEQGYERGYQRALADVRTSLLALTEDYLRGFADSPPELRSALRGLEAYLQRHFQSHDRQDFVSDGLGI